MKKLLSFLAVGALALGLIGCSGDLHDAEIIDLFGYGIRGTMTGWDKADDEPLTKNDDGTYAFSFTATGETDNFAVIEMGDASWNTAYRLAQPKSEGDTANTFDTEKGMEQKVYQGQSADCCTIKGLKKGDKVDLLITPDTTFIPVDSADAVKMPMKTGGEMAGAGNAKITGCKASTNYTMTVVANPDTSISVKVESAGAGADSTGPVPYYFDGLYLVGGCFKIGDMKNLWSFGSANLIYGASLDKKTGIVTYKKDIVATAESGEMGINDSSWGNKQNGKGITVNANADDYTELNGTEGSNFKVSGLTVGKAYRVEIKTTPDKDVLIKIYEIASVTFKFEVTGLSEGNLAWIGGNFWGSSWDNGWPIEAWNKKVGCGLSVSDNAVADENGVAAFNDKWNVSTVAKPGEKLSYNFKVIATDTDWSGNPSQQTGDLSVDINIDEDATYKISINIDDEKITVTKL